MPVSRVVPFTPGPWEIREVGPHKNTEIVSWWDDPTYGIPRPRLIATVLPRNDGRSNPALIAAAPEILAALEVAAEHVCSLKCPSVWREGEKQPHHEDCYATREAIAKARGAL